MRACDRNRGFIAERNYHTDLLWNYENFKRLAELPRCHCCWGRCPGVPSHAAGSPLPHAACPAVPQHATGLRWVLAETLAVLPQPLPPAWALLGAGGGGVHGRDTGTPLHSRAPGGSSGPSAPQQSRGPGRGAASVAPGAAPSVPCVLDAPQERRSCCLPMLLAARSPCHCCCLCEVLPAAAAMSAGAPGWDLLPVGSFPGNVAVPAVASG